MRHAMGCRMIMTACLLTSTLAAAAQTAHTAQPAEPVIRIYRLEHAEAESVLSIVSGMLGGGDSSYATTLDPRTNSVIVRSSDSVHEQVRALLSELDVPAAPGEASTLFEKPDDMPQAARVRVAWLVSGAAEQTGLRDVPDDLAGVREEMERLGVKDLKLAGQFVVSVLATGESKGFKAEGSVQLEHEWEFHLQGRYVPVVKAMGHDQLELEVITETRKPYEVERGGAIAVEYESDITSVSTRLALPFDHPVVLATAPSRTMSSVFVVTLSESGAAGDVEATPTRR
jgi:hypothetical protein